MKPMLAEDWIEEKVQFPVAMQPKIDGVRGINLFGSLTGRSLKQHANIHTTKFFSQTATLRLDGELACGDQTDPELCRKTTSALNTVKGEPLVDWHIFDVVVPGLTFIERHAMLEKYIAELKCLDNYPLAQRLHVVPYRIVRSMEELISVDDEYLDAGYEGSILRKIDGFYKYGRSTVREGLLLRIKRFIEEDAVVLEIDEGQTNLNEAKVNELGRTERSTHAENMVPNGMVGNLVCELTKDVVHRGEKLFVKGQRIRVSAGRMPHDDRKRYFEQQHLLIGKTIKFKTFPIGVKDKPRFPTFQSLRSDADKEAQ